MAIITLSRELGSHGSVIANALGERLGSPVLDKVSLEAELEEHGVPREWSQRFDEKRPGFWDRLSVLVDRYRHYLTLAMFEAARRGSCVIVGRGGQVVLAGLPGVLHLRVVASRATRQKRLQARERCSPEEALQLLDQSDRDRAGFARFFFDVDGSEPALYDLVINTDVLGTAEAVRIVADLLEAPVLKAQRTHTAELLEDCCLAQRVRGALLFDTDRPLYILQVSAQGGVVTLSGSIPNREHIAHCEQVARRVLGVRDVVNQLHLGVPPVS